MIDIFGDVFEFLFRVFERRVFFLVMLKRVSIRESFFKVILYCKGEIEV